MSEEWEYIEEAIAVNQQDEWLDSCPPICRDCRWLDSYYQMGCTQLAYPDAKNHCVFYTNHKWFRRLWLFKKWDLHYSFWLVKVLILWKVLRQQPNIVGSWRQWEYEDYNDDEDLEDW